MKNLHNTIKIFIQYVNSIDQSSFLRLLQKSAFSYVAFRINFVELKYCPLRSFELMLIKLIKKYTHLEPNKEAMP